MQFVQQIFKRFLHKILKIITKQHFAYKEFYTIQEWF